MERKKRKRGEVAKNATQELMGGKITWMPPRNSGEGVWAVQELRGHTCIVRGEPGWRWASERGRQAGWEAGGQERTLDALRLSAGWLGSAEPRVGCCLRERPDWLRGSAV